MEFMKAKSYHLVAISLEVSEEEQIKRLKFLVDELQRLFQHPQLFQSNKTRARFFALLGVDSRLQFGKASSDLLVEAEIRKIMGSSRKNETRKSFLDGSRGWENFLLDGAPGTGFNYIQTLPRSVFQAVPAVGIRIVADFEREEAEIIRFVEQVSLNNMPVASSVAGADVHSLKYLSMSKLRKPHF